MNKKQKKMLTRIIIAAVMIIVLNLIQVTGHCKISAILGNIFNNRLCYFKESWKRNYKSTSFR